MAGIRIRRPLPSTFVCRSFVDRLAVGVMVVVTAVVVVAVAVVAIVAIVNCCCCC